MTDCDYIAIQGTTLTFNEEYKLEDCVSLTDAFLGYVMGKVADESITLEDSLSKVLVRATESDSIAIVDVFELVKSLPPVDDTIDLTDLRVFSLEKAQGDVLIVADSLTKAVVMPSFADMLDFTDGGALGIIAPSSDAISFSDGYGLGYNFADGLALTDLVVFSNSMAPADDLDVLDTGLVVLTATGGDKSISLVDDLALGDENSLVFNWTGPEFVYAGTDTDTDNDGSPVWSVDLGTDTTDRTLVVFTVVKTFNGLQYFSTLDCNGTAMVEESAGRAGRSSLTGIEYTTQVFVLDEETEVNATTFNGTITADPFDMEASIYVLRVYGANDIDAVGDVTGRTAIGAPPAGGISLFLTTEANRSTILGITVTISGNTTTLRTGTESWLGPAMVTGVYRNVDTAGSTSVGINAVGDIVTLCVGSAIEIKD